MPYNYNFRVLAVSYNCLSTYQYIGIDEAEEMFRKLEADDEYESVQIHPIKHNTDPMRADYEYRLFDIVNLFNQVGMVLCTSDQDEPEFHGFRPTVEECLDYVDNYYYEKELEEK